MSCEIERSGFWSRLSNGRSCRLFRAHADDVTLCSPSTPVEGICGSPAPLSLSALNRRLYHRRRTMPSFRSREGRRNQQYTATNSVNRVKLRSGRSCPLFRCRRCLGVLSLRCRSLGVLSLRRRSLGIFSRRRRSTTTVGLSLDYFVNIGGDSFGAQVVACEPTPAQRNDRL